jgi:hypothetical protein
MNREKATRTAILAAIAVMSVGFVGSSTVSAAPANGTSTGAAAATLDLKQDVVVVVRRRPVVVRRPVVIRRSDMMLKHDISLLGHLDNGLGFYRFSYNGSDKAYVGVMAQEVQTVLPEAVVRGSDGYLRVYYDKLGVKFQTYDRWVASGAHVPAGLPSEH